jgi:hypothetical protein
MTFWNFVGAFLIQMAKVSIGKSNPYHVHQFPKMLSSISLHP